MGEPQGEARYMVIAEGSSQSWEEVLETTRSVDSHIHESQEIGLDVGEGHFRPLKLGYGTAVIKVGFSSINRHTSVGNMLHLGREQTPCMWEIGEDETNDQADETGNGSFDDIEPLLGGHSSPAIQAVENTCGDQISKRSAEQRTPVEDCHAHREFFLGIPLGKVEQDSSKERSL